jgi:methylenetetrahydrofolate reductase (NADPH)
MSFSEIYRNASSPVCSLEFFPPKKEESLPGALELMSRLSELKPGFMTVTYGAGGGTRELTGKMTSFIANELSIPSVAHLTCVGHSVAEVDLVLDNLQELGIRYILALRGDPPVGQEKFKAHPEGFSCARELIAHIKKRDDFSIGAAGYPETHPEATSSDDDILYLKSKVDAGAEVILTQLFFSNDYYFSFVERCRLAGITVPIVPGVLPISNVKQIKKFTSLCGTSIPERLGAELQEIEDDRKAVKEFGVKYAVQQCKELLDGGAPGVHLYTLNKSFQVEQVVEQLRKSKHL